MELDWTTLVLEIINFLVLIWILKHFFYRPVLNIIKQRRVAIEESLANAEQLHAEGVQLKGQYEERLGLWEKERQHARESLQLEIDEERNRKMDELTTILEQEREKARVGEAHRIHEQFNKLEEHALHNGTLFATRLLEQTASPELENRLIEMFLTEVKNLPPAQTKQLRRSWEGEMLKATVISGYPLTEPHQQQLESAINILAGVTTQIEFNQDSALLAGVRLTIDGWVLGLNLRDELHGFSMLELEMARDS